MKIRNLVTGLCFAGLSIVGIGASAHSHQFCNGFSCVKVSHHHGIVKRKIETPFGTRTVKYNKHNGVTKVHSTDMFGNTHFAKTHTHVRRDGEVIVKRKVCNDGHCFHQRFGN